MIAEAGYKATAGIVTAMIVALSVIPTLVVQWKGRAWR
jgi:predicted RND superfamily exporter protein